MNEPDNPARLADARAAAVAVLDANLARDAGPLLGGRLEDLANLAVVVDHLDRRLAAADVADADRLAADLEAVVTAAAELLEAVATNGLQDVDHWQGRFAGLIAPLTDLARVVQATGRRLAAGEPVDLA